MKKILFTLLIALFILQNHGQTQNQVKGKEKFRYSGKVNNGVQTIKFTITKKAFIENNHEITYVDPNKEWTARIDGKVPIGTGGSGKARFELDTFIVEWEDKIFNVPKEIYSDCYDPILKSVNYLPSEDGNEILISLGGSDGGGTYTVAWIIRKSEKCDRFLNLYDYQFNQ